MDWIGSSRGAMASCLISPIARREHHVAVRYANRRGEMAQPSPRSWRSHCGDRAELALSCPHECRHVAWPPPPCGRLPLQNCPGRLEPASAAPTVGKAAKRGKMTTHGHLAEVAIGLSFCQGVF